MPYKYAAGARAVIWSRRLFPEASIYVIAPQEQVMTVMQRTGMHQDVFIQDVIIQDEYPLG